MTEEVKLNPEALPENMNDHEQDVSKIPLKTRLFELFWVCLKIGLTSFGAPTAHIAMMEREFVRRHKWITERHFLDLLAAANLIPGPNASETCYHVGYVRAGYPGLLVAGISFISPAFLSSLLLAWIYTRYGTLPQVEGIFYILNPLVLAIVLETTWQIGKASFNGWKQVLIFVVVVAAKLLGLNESLALIGGGFLGILLHHTLANWPKGSGLGQLLLAFLPVPMLTEFVGNVAVQVKESIWNIFIYFFKTGSILFGSSLVLFALIEEDVVNRFGWLTSQQLADAISMGQITPGPVLSASTFVGYITNGLSGAVAATLGVFLPSFLIVAVTAPLVKKMRENHIAHSFLEGVNSAVVALVLFVCINLAQSALVDVWTVLAMLAGLAVLIFTKAQPYVLVIAGFAIGILRMVLM